MPLGIGSAGTGLGKLPARSPGRSPLGAGGGLTGKQPMQVPGRQPIAPPVKPGGLGGSEGFTTQPVQPKPGGLGGSEGMMLNQVNPAARQAQLTGRRPMIMNRAGPDYGAPGQPGSSTSGNAVSPAGDAIAAGVVGAAYPVMQGQQQAQQMQAYYDALMGVMNTGNAGNNNLLALQQQFAQQQHNWAANQAQQNYGYESQLLNNAGGRANMDVLSAQFDIDKLNNQQGYNNYLGGAYDQQYQADLNYIGQQYGFNSREYKTANAQLDAQRIANWQQFNLGNRSTDLQFDRQTRLAKSDAISRGALSTAGFGDTLREFGTERQIAGEGIDSAYRLGVANIQAGAERAQLGYESGSAGLDKQKTDAGIRYGLDKQQLSLAQQNLGMDIRQASLAKAKLESVAKDYGIKADQLEFALQSGLEKLGMDAYQSIAQIGQMMASNDANLVAQGSALIAQILGVKTGF